MGNPCGKRSTIHAARSSKQGSSSAGLKGHVQEELPRFEASAEEVQRITGSFPETCSCGDLHGLVQVLHEDTVMTSDGGGKVASAQVPVVGVDRIGRLFLGLFKKALFKQAPLQAKLSPCRVNGRPG